MNGAYLFVLLNFVSFSCIGLEIPISEERHFYLAIIVSPGALMKRPTNASGVLYSVDHRVEQIGWIRPAEEVPQVDGHPNLWLDKVRLVDMEVTYR